jgi:hypothetical protein
MCDAGDRAGASLLHQCVRSAAPKQAGPQHWYQRPPARRRRSARTAFTSRSISSIDIGSMPGFGHAPGDRQKRIDRLPAPDRIPKQPFERL